MWTPYEQRTQRKPDFLVKYRFIPYEEGGRVQRPGQGYRSDLHYDGEDLETHGLYMVHPEFLDEDGAVIMDTQLTVAAEGLAFMWILLFEQTWKAHQKKALPGRRCWFMEGPRKVAEATVIEQIGLIHNITSPDSDP